MSDLYWLTDEQMAKFSPFLPEVHSKPRVDDRGDVEWDYLHQSHWVALAQCSFRIRPAQNALLPVETLER